MENFENFEIEEDVRQSDEYAKYMEREGWRVVKVSDIYTFRKRVGPLGILKAQRFKKIADIGMFESALRENLIDNISLEPLTFPIKLGRFRQSSSPLLATKTIRLNLREDVPDIFSSFSKECRYLLRKENIGLSVEINRFSDFYQILKSSGERLKIWIPEKSKLNNMVTSFEKNIFCLTINNQAGCLVIIYKRTAYYYYAGSTKEGTLKNLPYSVVWKAIQEAKSRGAVVWDFEGIYDERWPDKRWIGFSHFKRSFGGKEIEFPGRWQKWRIGSYPK